MPVSVRLSAGGGLTSVRYSKGTEDNSLTLEKTGCKNQPRKSRAFLTTTPRLFTVVWREGQICLLPADLTTIMNELLVPKGLFSGQSSLNGHAPVRKKVELNEVQIG